MQYLVDSNAEIPDFFAKIVEQEKAKAAESKRFLRSQTDKVMAKYMNKLSVKSHWITYMYYII